MVSPWFTLVEKSSHLQWKKKTYFAFTISQDLANCLKNKRNKIWIYENPKVFLKWYKIGGTHNFPVHLMKTDLVKMEIPQLAYFSIHLSEVKNVNVCSKTNITMAPSKEHLVILSHILPLPRYMLKLFFSSHYQKFPTCLPQRLCPEWPQV